MSRALRLTAFALRLRVRAHLRSGPHLAWVLAVAVIAVAHGLGLSYALAELDLLRPHTEQGLRIAMAAAVVVLWLAPFVPAYSPGADPIPAYHPVGRWERALTGVLWDLIALPFLALVLFFITLFFASGRFGAADLLAAVIATVAAAFVQRSGRLLIDFRAPARALHAAVVAVIGAVLLQAVLRTPPATLLPAIGGLAVAAAVHHLGLAAAIARRPGTHAASSPRGAAGRRGRAGGTGLSRLATLLVVRTRRLRVPLLIGLSLKVLVLVFLGPAVLRPESEPALRVLLLVMLSPFVLFTYALNNTFGYLAPAWDTARIHGGGAGAALRLYGDALRLPLLADALISAAAASFLGLLGGGLVLFYAGSACALAAVGLWSSLVDPRPVRGDELVRLRNAVSPWFSIGGSLPVAVLAAGFFHLGLAAVPAIAGPLLLLATILGARRAMPRLAARLYPRLEGAS